MSNSTQKAILLLTAGETQKEIVDKLNISQPRVCQIANKAEVKKQVLKSYYLQKELDITY